MHTDVFLKYIILQNSRKKMSIYFTMNDESLSTTFINALNEYCLLHIFSFLNLKDQHQVYFVNEHFRYLIKRLWLSKYPTKFNFTTEKDHLALLPNDDAVFDVINEIAKKTKELVNMPSRIINLLQEHSKDTLYPNVEILSVKYFQEDKEGFFFSALELMQLPEICPNLNTLDLLWYEIGCFKPDVFQCMKHLRILTLIPSLKIVCFRQYKQADLIRCVALCKSLQYLRIAASYLNYVTDEIVQMKSLRMLQLYQVPQQNTMMEVTVKNVLIAARSAKRQIIGLYIKSDLDKSVVQNFLSEQSKDDSMEISKKKNKKEADKKLLKLSHFSWEPRIRVVNDCNFTLRWRVIHPQVKEYVTKFLQNAHDLKVIDLSNNLHYHDHEIEQIQEDKPNAELFRKKPYEIVPFFFKELRVNEETITFEFLYEN